jgi:biofilm PGA synthesis N-glycosyltransferase PgaC
MLSVIAICSSVIILCYAVYVLLLLRYWFRPLPPTSSDSAPGKSVVVIIPFRNEANNLPDLLNALQSQDYPKDKVKYIFVNDHSDDDSCSIIERFQGSSDLPIELWYLPNDSRGKKSAIRFAIDTTKSDIIVTIDADVIPGPSWLSGIKSVYEHNEVDLLILPVLLSPVQSRLERLQQLDFLHLSGLTGASAKMGSALMCNGANLSFKRASYMLVMNNISYQNRTSGDDMFLMMAMKRAGMKIRYHFETSVVVSTKPCSTWRELLQQRVRWASKINALSDLHIMLSGLLLSIANLSMLAIVLIAFTNPIYWEHAGVLFLIKMMVECCFAYCIAKSFQINLRLGDALLLSLLYPMYFVLILMLIVFYPTEWKGRAISLRTAKKA